MFWRQRFVCQAGFIVTKNLRHFPADALAEYGIRALHPDDFIYNLLDVDPECVCKAAQTHRQSLKNPPFTIDEYLVLLERQELHRTVEVLRQFTDRL